MKTIYFLFLALLLFALPEIIISQTTMHSYYGFSVSSTTYTELTSPTVLQESGGDDFYLVNGGSGPTGVVIQ